jgi:pseudouridine synthase
VARWISKFGVLSRAEAERRVRAGRVRLNGARVLDPDRPCHPGRDRIELDGRPLRPARRIYLAMHKPAGCITTAHDPEGRPTVHDLLPRRAEGAQAVGRLDADTSGLLLFTSDTSFAARVTDSAGGVEKVYEARVSGKVTPDEARRFEQGIVLDGRATLPARCRVLEAGDRSTRVEVTLTEGRNRQVRRMWKALGHTVIALHRTRIGPIQLGDLPPGRTRRLTEVERAWILLPPPERESHLRGASTGSGPRPASPSSAAGPRSGRSTRPGRR